MSDDTPLVFVVEADASVRQRVESLARSLGLRVDAFATAREFLARPRPAVPSCLVLDVSLPDLDGLELQARMAAERREMPVIFVATCRDVQTSVRAMKAGALEFLTQPFDATELLDAFRIAVERSRAALARETRLRALMSRYTLLTAREREVMAMVVAGRLNKLVGADLGISEITVKAHRGRVMRKMQAASLAHLIDMASGLGLPEIWPAASKLVGVAGAWVRARADLTHRVGERSTG